MENWYLVSFKFLDTGLWFYNLVLTENEEEIIKYFSKHEEVRLRNINKKEFDILKETSLPVIDLTIQ